MSLTRADLTPYSGDGLLVYDTDTKLEWLNLSLTSHRSCVDTQASPFMTQHRFEFATGPQITALWSHAGIAQQGGPVGPASPGTAIGVEVLLHLLGGYVFSPPHEWSRGLAPEGPFTADTPVVAFELHLNRTASPAAGYGDSGAGSWKAGQRYENTGVYLVRQRP